MDGASLSVTNSCIVNRILKKNGAYKVFAEGERMGRISKVGQ